uniref:subtilisin n=1 Tax=Chromera velia CCMP2878 TaxID=1169474 RepID=A0A0G4I7Z8_9ALVE|eukprot:Cvel_11794.t1-p1 / transcript=Cvel_11794.t1 / gene=Cvel_11794 / organism=Chromera_velia_CCMP2878 / gene_product=Thermitase, putative / transcript_product=Thermitase, putative / location=Cvel_scaffold750:37424-43313(+) / protein_length=916 / sequence_SO=supercontig / SO=protein_coding / is_pseudo=false
MTTGYVLLLALSLVSLGVTCSEDVAPKKHKVKLIIGYDDVDSDSSRRRLTPVRRLSDEHPRVLKEMGVYNLKWLPSFHQEILELDDDVDEQETESILESLSKVQHIKYVEVDQKVSLNLPQTKERDSGSQPVGHLKDFLSLNLLKDLFSFNTKKGNETQTQSKNLFSSEETAKERRLQQIDPLLQHLFREASLHKTLPDDPFFQYQWHFFNSSSSDIRLPQAWKLTDDFWGLSRLQEVVVAVIDTGVDLTHPELEGQLWFNKGEIPGDGIDNDRNGFVDDYWGWDFAEDSPSPQDRNGHGTHCAGSIASLTNNGMGVGGICGTAKVMALKFLDQNGEGMVSDAITALDYAVRMGAQVSSNSWGGGSDMRSLRDAVEAAQRANMLMVVAAGNSGHNSANVPYYPAHYDMNNIVSVASVTDKGVLASHSNYGQSVSLCAPGTRLASLWLWEGGKPNTGYWMESGTSMAAPLVAGVAALLKAIDPSLSAAEMRIILLRSSRKLTPLNGKVATSATLDALQAVRLLFLERASSLPVPGQTQMPVQPQQPQEQIQQQPQQQQQAVPTQPPAQNSAWGDWYDSSQQRGGDTSFAQPGQGVQGVTQGQQQGQGAAQGQQQGQGFTGASSPQTSAGDPQAVSGGTSGIPYSEEEARMIALLKQIEEQTAAQQRQIEQATGVSPSTNTAPPEERTGLPPGAIGGTWDRPIYPTVVNTPPPIQGGGPMIINPTENMQSGRLTPTLTPKYGDGNPDPALQLTPEEIALRQQYGAAGFSPQNTAGGGGTSASVPSSGGGAPAVAIGGTQQQQFAGASSASPIKTSGAQRTQEQAIAEYEQRMAEIEAERAAEERENAEDEDEDNDGGRRWRLFDDSDDEDSDRDREEDPEEEQERAEKEQERAERRERWQRWSANIQAAAQAAAAAQG